MAINPLKAFLFAGGGVVAVAGAAYVAGAVDPLFQAAPPAQVAALPPAQDPADTTTAPGTGDRLPAKDAAAAPEAQPAASGNPPPEAAAPAAQVLVPSFDVVRVEGDGSVVIAGSAAPKAKVEVLNGETVLGSTEAGADGAFAIVLDTPLKPGDYQITLRSTTPDNVTAASQQTAVVSIPDKPDGQVLAMVEEPGKPAELLSVPAPEKQPDKPAEAAVQPAEAATQPVQSEPKPAESVSAEPKPAEAAPAEAKPTEVEQKPAEAASAPAAAETATPPEQPTAPAIVAKVVVEAVEIDGGKIFVAGVADAGRKVRAYANEILLGDATTSPDGHFLVEASRDLPVGTYNVRVDALDADGAKVVARATVPFEREPGEAIAAVASAEPPKPAVEQPAQAAASQPETPAATGEKPAEVPAASPPADAVPETVAPKLRHADSAVIIRRHDTLWRISRRVYGHGIRYSTIYLANQDQISDPDRIWPGQVFKVPETSREGEAADLTVLGDQMTTAPAKTE